MKAKLFLRTLCSLGGLTCGFTVLLSMPVMGQTVDPMAYAFHTLDTKSGSGTAAGVGQFANPAGLAVDSAGNVYVANTRHQTICRMTPAGEVTIVAGRTDCRGSVDGTGGAARFCYPRGLAVDGTGNIYVADSGNATIRRITPTGVVTTLAGETGCPGAADGAGNFAQFNYPNSVAVDDAGNVYVADQFNFTIRKISPDGMVSTLAGQAGCYGRADGQGDAAQFDFPVGVAVDGTGNLYVADRLNNAIRKVTPAGMVTTLAGEAAQINSPGGVAADAANNVYVADTKSHSVRRVTPDGVVTSLAGKARKAGKAGNVNSTGAGVFFGHPLGIAVDRMGGVYVADSSNGTIQMGLPAHQPQPHNSSPASPSFAFTSR